MNDTTHPGIISRMAEIVRNHLTFRRHCRELECAIAQSLRGITDDEIERAKAVVEWADDIATHSMRSPCEILALLSQEVRHE